MTHEFFEYESDIVQELLLYVKELGKSDHDKETCLDIIKLKLEEY